MEKQIVQPPPLTQRMYDLSTMTRDQLLLLLSRANDEMLKYTRYYKELEKVKERLEYEKKKSLDGCGCLVLTLVVFWLLIAYGFFSFFHNPTNLDVDSEGIIFVISLFVIITFIVIIIFIQYRKKTKKDAEITQNKIKTSEEELRYLQKKANESFEKFFAVIEPYKFPRDYWYEYAINTMLEFVVNYRASNWERVTDLYEEHLHRMKMEENARQTLNQLERQLEQLEMQTEYARESRNAARWAAAGAWTSAIGTWRINSKL